MKQFQAFFFMHSCPSIQCYKTLRPLMGPWKCGLTGIWLVKKALVNHNITLWDQLMWSYNQRGVQWLQNRDRFILYLLAVQDRPDDCPVHRNSTPLDLVRDHILNSLSIYDIKCLYQYFLSWIHAIDQNKQFYLLCFKICLYLDWIFCCCFIILLMWLRIWNKYWPCVFKSNKTAI